MADDYGYAQQATKEGVDVTLQKSAEITQVMILQVIQAMQQRQQGLRNSQEKSRTHVGARNGSQPGEHIAPQQNSNQPIEQFKAFYQAYVEEGVGPEVAKAAAIDAALGLGSSDSRAISAAEEQIMTQVEQQQAGSQAQQENMESDRPPERSQPTVQAQHFQGIAEEYSRGYQSIGATPATAQAAGRETAAGKGANNSPAIRQAHIEILHRYRLSAMYQGIFEKHGVSKEDAKVAGALMAKGQGANRSSVVRKAYSQAFGDIRQASRHTQQATNASKTAQPSSSSLDIPTEIWDKYRAKGVTAGVAAHNPRIRQLNDLRTAKEALTAGYSEPDVQAAIAQNSPHARQPVINAQQYAKTVIQQVKSSEKPAALNKEVRNQRSRTRSPQRQGAQQKRPKAKAHDKGMRY